MEIRVGDELINNRFAQPLSDRNDLCGNIQSLSSSLLTFTLECQKTLIGRYLSIQVMSYGQLHLDEVKIEEPEPGINVVTFLMKIAEMTYVKISGVCSILMIFTAILIQYSNGVDCSKITMNLF